MRPENDTLCYRVWNSILRKKFIREHEYVISCLQFSNYVIYFFYDYALIASYRRA